MALSPGTPVRSIDNPSREGVVTNAEPRSRTSGLAYQIRWSDGLTDFVREDELEVIDNVGQQDPYAIVKAGRYGRAADLRRNLTYTHLSGRLANLVYSMGVTDTDFYAHQYRPLLTLLDSPTNGLLIADEVGLGKTIEAGLIWTEFRARFDMRRLLIICPAMLREKWRDELRNRFGVDARITDARDLLDELAQSSYHGEGKAWILSYQAARPPRDWSPDAKKPERPSARWRLADFLRSKAQEEPIIDMVVFDEAHYMRNTETASWQLADLIREVAAYQVMLSATPINLKNEDLFNLLRLLDPDHFASVEDFGRMLEANRPLVAARDAVVNRTAGVDEVMARLSEMTRQPILAETRQLQAILEDPPTAERLSKDSYRAELADALERMNLLGHAITRTRKRDIHLRRIYREVKREAVPMNEIERKLYEAVTEATREYAYAEGISDGFLLAMPQRQVTSCPAAIASAWRQHGRAADELVEDSLQELEDDDESPRVPLRDILAHAITSNFDVDELERHDSKFERLLEVTRDYLGHHPTEKIVLFTTFRATAAYLKRRLEAVSLPSMILWGGEAVTKQERIDEFRESPDLRILISTEVAAEGVDLQFCKVLVNYDLPWNPTRIEQRIGRIDRLGQKSELIHIWNLYFANTIDERIVTRLFDRLKIFEEALGEAEAVVGDAVRRLESELLRRPLTAQEEENQIAQTAKALENIRLQREELERNAAHMLAHGQRVMERVESAQELARRVTEADLVAYIADYLNRFATGHRFVQLGSDPFVFEVQLPPELASRFDEYLNRERLTGKSALGLGQPRKCRFLNRVSERPRPGEEIVHQFHPLVRFVTHDLRARNEHYYPVVAVSAGGGAWKAGDYVFYTRSWLFKGVREEELLSAVAIELDTGIVVEEELGDALVQHARIASGDWVAPSASVDAEMVCRRFEQAEELLDKRYQEVLLRKRNENADRAQFQLRSIERHLDRRVPRLKATLNAHLAFGRSSLAKATQGQIDKLLARMQLRKERIAQAERVVAERNFVCAGLIRIQ